MQRIALMLCMLGLAGFGIAGGTPDAKFVEIDDILDRPDAYVGERVTIRGEVDDILSANAITVEDEDVADDDILVVSKRPFNEFLGRVYEDQDLRLTGVVDRMDLENVESKFGLLDLSEREEREFENQPFLIADEGMTVDR